MFIWDIIIDNSTFTNNRANYRGGALYAEGKLNISNSNFSNNKASYGGAISNQNNAKSIITNSTFKNNSASSIGGAIRNNGGQLDINDSTFDNNSAGEYSGAVSSFTDSATEVYNSVFMSNSAGDRGGAIRNGGNLIVFWIIQWKTFSKYTIQWSIINFHNLSAQKSLINDEGTLLEGKLNGQTLSLEVVIFSM